MPRPSRPWFRFYVEACADRKLRRLKPEYRWLFVACLAAARQSERPGELLVGSDPMDVADLADFAAMPEKQVTAGLEALIAAGVVEPWPWVIPRWDDRQFESDDITARTRKHRSKERSNDVPGNAPDTETDTELPPNPPQAGGHQAPHPSHDGTHPNCRACGTTRRSGVVTSNEKRGRIPDVADLALVPTEPIGTMPPELRRRNGTLDP